MRKDIKSINEAYIKATTTLTEQTASQNYSNVKGDNLIEVWQDTYVSEEDSEPVNLLYAFRYYPGSKGDYDTPSTSDDLRYIGTYDSEGNEVAVDDTYIEDAAAKAWKEVEYQQGSEDEESGEEDTLYKHYGLERPESDGDVQDDPTYKFEDEENQNTDWQAFHRKWEDVLEKMSAEELDVLIKLAKQEYDFQTEERNDPIDDPMGWPWEYR